VFQGAVRTPAAISSRPSASQAGGTSAPPTWTNGERFGFPIGDAVISEHVQRIDLRNDQILALFDDDLDVVAAAHIVRACDDVAEFALSVDREWRGRGVGSALFDRAVLWARNRGIRQAIVYCLNENQATRHIVRKAGGR
jgi:GNAT superfamily N-acetyltransferase